MTSDSLRKLLERKRACYGKTIRVFASDNWNEEHTLYIDMEGSIHHICCGKDLWN